MNAQQKIREILTETYGDEGRVSAMEIWKGYHESSMRVGWHMRDFGRNDVHYMGKSVSEVQLWADDVAEYRKQTA